MKASVDKDGATGGGVDKERTSAWRWVRKERVPTADKAQRVCGRMVVVEGEEEEKKARTTLRRCQCQCQRQRQCDHVAGSAVRTPLTWDRGLDRSYRAPGVLLSAPILQFLPGPRRGQAETPAGHRSDHLGPSDRGPPRTSLFGRGPA